MIRRWHSADPCTATFSVGILALVLLCVSHPAPAQTQTCGVQWGDTHRISFDSVPSISTRFAVQGDTIHVLWYGLDTLGTLAQSGVQYSRSIDGGATFSAPRVLLPIANAFTPGYIAAAGPFVSVVTLAAVDTFFGSVLLRSTDAGATWAPPQFLLRSRQPEGLVAADSLFFFHHSNFNGTNYGFLRSADDGATWQTFTAQSPHFASMVIYGGAIEGIGAAAGNYSTEVGYFTMPTSVGQWYGPDIISTDDLTPSLLPAITVNTRGDLFASWTDSGSVYLRTSRNSGISWLPQVRISTRKNAVVSDLAAGAEFVATAWDNDFGNGGGVLVRTSNDFGQRFCPIDSPSVASAVGGPVVALADSNLYIAWSETNGGDEEIYFRKGTLTHNPDLIGKPPASFALLQNYPNPANSSTTIQYDLPKAAHVVLSVYSLLGQEVARLVDADQPADRYNVHLESSRLATGVYFYRLQTPSFTEIKKLIILK